MAGSAATSQSFLSVDDYLEGERHSEIKHEYVGGHVYAMAGASDDHNRIVGNIFSARAPASARKAVRAFHGGHEIVYPGSPGVLLPRRNGNM